MKFSAKVREKLGYYVYLYVDPRDGKPFYIGKGRGNRAFGHMTQKAESKKTEVIRQLQQLQLEPIVEILKYGLTEEQALLVESTAIDLLDISNLTNVVRGHGSRHGGRALAAEIARQFDAKPVKVTDPVILINISRAFRFTLTPHELYDCTRSAWVVNPERHDAKYALSVYRGVVREVYEIQQWLPAGSTMRVFDKGVRRELTKPEQSRLEFVGRVAKNQVRNKYFGRSVANYLKKGAQNPILYVNC